MQMLRAWVCMLDIIWNAVEDEYLTVIMYLLCSIPMRFSGKTSQMIHNDEAKQPVVCISTVVEPPEFWIIRVTRWKLLCFFSHFVCFLMFSFSSQFSGSIE